MREILFRGKIDNGEWEEGLTLQWVVDSDPQHEKQMFLTPYGYSFPAKVDPETVCQYTGLTDRVGNKIFEGDIVKTPLFTPDVMAIGFIEGAFCLVDSKKEYIADIHYVHHAGINQTNIIGNIFDNPELLRGDE